MINKALSLKELEKIISIISNQFYINNDKNIFLNNEGLCFSNEMSHSLKVERCLWQRISESQWTNILEYLVNKFLHSLYDTNQYINFEKSDYILIYELYNELFLDISSDISEQEISLLHYSKVRILIERLQPKLYQNNIEGKMEFYVCSEYTAKFQLNLLQLKLSKIKGPLLDIGCGENGYMVAELRKQGINAVGIDRLCQKREGLIQISWFDFNYGDKKWGTIISNLSFSSHFINHIYNDSPEIKKFYQVYSDILMSLMPGGVWHYAPSLPQIEAKLPIDFSVNNFKIDDVFSRTIIKRKS